MADQFKYGTILGFYSLIGSQTCLLKTNKVEFNKNIVRGNLWFGWRFVVCGFFTTGRIANFLGRIANFLGGNR